MDSHYCFYLGFAFFLQSPAIVLYSFESPLKPSCPQGHVYASVYCLMLLLALSSDSIRTTHFVAQFALVFVALFALPFPPTVVFLSITEWKLLRFLIHFFNEITFQKLNCRGIYALLAALSIFLTLHVVLVGLHARRALSNDLGSQVLPSVAFLYPVL